MKIDGAKLRSIREQLLLTQSQFADKIGVSREWVQAAEKEGERRVLRRKLGDVADALHVSPHDLIAKEIFTSPMGAGERFEVVNARKYPVFHVTISAGRWSESEARSADDADDFVLLDANRTPRDAFVLRIDGDCMEPDYPSGSTIVFAPVRPGERGAIQFEDNRDYYVEHSDGKSTFKRVRYIDRDGDGFFELMPLNRSYPPFEVPSQMIARMSRAIRVVVVRELA